MVKENKEIMNAYKRKTLIKSKKQNDLYNTYYYIFYYVIMLLIIVPFAPIFILGIYLHHSILQILISSIVAFILYWGIVLCILMPFMGANVYSNPAHSKANDSLIIFALCIGYIPQLLYIINNLNIINGNF